MAEFDGLYDMDGRILRMLNQVHLSMEIYVVSYLATENGLSIRKDMVSAFTPGTEI